MKSVPVASSRWRGVRRVAAGLGALVVTCGLGGAVSGASGAAGVAGVAPGDAIDRAAGKADTVFTASVTTSAQDTIGTGKKARRVTRYTAEVDRVYQGRVSKSTVLITSRLKADCGYGAIPTDRPWVFFVTGRGESFFGNFCDGTAEATTGYLRRVENVLGGGEVLVSQAPARPPLKYTRHDTAATTSLNRLLAPGAGVTLIGLLGLVLARSRRARPS